MRISGKALMGLVLQHKGAKASNKVPLLTRGAGPLNRVRVGADWWVGPEGWLRWSAHPLGGAV